MNEKIYNKYINLLNQGKSKAEALRKVNVPRSTMSDYIKRRDKLIKHEYHLIKCKDDLTIIVGSDSYKLTKTFIDKNDFLVEDLLIRDDMVLSNAELKQIESLKYNEAIVAVTNTQKSDFELKNDKAYYKGIELSIDLFNVLKAAYEKQNDKNNKTIINFVNLLMQNPDKDVIRQIYPFLMHNDIKICNNGYLLTYKSIRKDFTDHYTGTYDNSVGKYVKMDRDKVDPNPNKTCSHGLHVGSLSYVDRIYSNNIIVSCIVNPMNVVSIPTDYNGAKMRVCEYKVSAVHKGKQK
jgi:hypothetical protein